MASAPITPHIDHVEEFLSHCHRRKYSAKSTIIYAGDQGDTLYYIVKGSLSVVIEDENIGKEIILAYLNPGDFVGEMGLFDQEERSAWIRTKTECEVGEISYGKFVELSNQRPEFLFAVSKQIVQRLRDTTRKVGDLAFLDATGRVARTLLNLCNEPDAMTHPDGMQIKITPQEIGRIVGCSREMVGRVLKDLEQRGLVSIAGKTMVVFGTR